jgi:hypothetical protein
MMHTKERKMRPHITFEFNTREFVASHATEPKGRGSWAFEFGNRAPVFTPSMTYGDAKKWIKEHIRSVAHPEFEGHVEINVCP